MRCGCSSQCSCAVQGDGATTTVSGTGSAANPYVVSATGGQITATDTTTVDHTLTGNGTPATPYNLSSTVKVSSLPGQLLQVEADGLHVDCADVITCVSGTPSPISTLDTPTVNLTGDGTPATPLQADVIRDPEATNLLQITAAGVDVPCEAVQDCVGQGFVDGLIYDDVGNAFRVRVDPAAGNNLSQSATGLYVPTGAATITAADTPCINLDGDGSGATPLTATPIVDPVAGNLLTCSPTGLRALMSRAACGLTGDGSAASPLAANVGVWSYPCSIDTSGGVVACDSNGQLRSEPRGMCSFTSFTEARNYSDVVVPAGFDQPGDSFATSVTNPDPCRPALVIVEREADVDFILPAGAGAAYGHSTDEVYYTRNTGTTTITDAHVQTTKIFSLGALLAPGASVPLTFDVTLGRGTGGATYNRIQVFIRALLISL